MVGQPARLDFNGTLSALQGLLGQTVGVAVTFGRVPLSFMIGELLHALEGDQSWVDLTHGTRQADMIQFGIQRGDTVAGAFILSPIAFHYGEVTSTGVIAHLVPQLSVIAEALDLEPAVLLRIQVEAVSIDD